VLVALGGLVAANGTRSFRKRRTIAAATLAHDTTVTTEQRAMGIMRRAVGPASAQAIPPAELRRRVANLASGTYIDDVLAQQDSALYRWPDHLRDAMRVYVEPSSEVPGWDPRLPLMVHDVFDEWAATGFPLRFTFVLDSAGADLTVRWQDRFPDEDGQRIGVTERIHSGDFRIVHASIVIALHDSAGRAISPTVVDGIVRHEVGHALGLNHANDSTSVMFHETATMMMSASDRATLRLLYLVPPGSLKD
jgi:hypothetical protein